MISRPIDPVSWREVSKIVSRSLTSIVCPSNAEACKLPPPGLIEPINVHLHWRVHLNRELVLRKQSVANLDRGTGETVPLALQYIRCENQGTD